MLHCLVCGGLCNRLQCMEAAIRLARDGGLHINIYWALAPDAMREFFSSMFYGLQTPVKLYEQPTYSGVVKQLFSWKNPFRYNPGEEEKLIRRCLTGKSSLLTAYYNCESFYRPQCGGGYDYSWLKPLPEIQKKIDSELERMGGGGATIGVHIRRTDNKWSTEHSPDDLFFAALDKEVEQNSTVRIYLASDDENTKQRFYARYGDRVLSRPIKPRHTSGSVADAVVDLMILSKMGKLYGCYRSSFSSVASRINGIPLHIISDIGVH